ncbi:MAG TPA: hypothetical protein VEI24_04385, partial [Nitrospiria bacterium]|nr:hypothetical protein [Nitrospiria bacterium]
MNDMARYFSVTACVLLLTGAGHLWAADTAMTHPQGDSSSSMAMPASETPGWQDQLKAQLTREENMEGREGRTDQVNN